jgi:ABC-type uncharacterized transport system substrate-binding protein
MQNQIEIIKENVKVINEKAKDDDELLTYVTEEVVDRVLIYLNDSKLHPRLNKIVARIVSGIFNQTAATTDGSYDTSVRSISDNGQSITYSVAVKNYLASSKDGELFGGFAELLAPHRKANVISGRS